LDAYSFTSFFSHLFTSYIYTLSLHDALPILFSYGYFLLYVYPTVCKNDHLYFTRFKYLFLSDRNWRLFCFSYLPDEPFRSITSWGDTWDHRTAACWYSCFGAV